MNTSVMFLQVLSIEIIMKFKKYQDIKRVTFGKRRYWNPPSYISIVLIDLITNQLIGVCGNIFKSLDRTIRRR